MDQTNSQISPVVEPLTNSTNSPLQLDGNSLSCQAIQNSFARNKQYTISNHQQLNTKLTQSRETLERNIAQGAKIYGVNTLFGGLANTEVEDLNKLQQQLILNHHSGAGDDLEPDDVRLSMIMRVNTLLRGVSGVRKEILERYIYCLNHNLTPRVKTLGSIGASGDLVPLSSIAGAVLGLSDSFELSDDSGTHSAKDLLKQHNLDDLSLKAKEGLGLINGTSCHTAIAANNLIQMVNLFNWHLKIQGLLSEILHADMGAFNAFIHQHRPHPGQIWVAKKLRLMLLDSTITRDRHSVEQDFAHDELIQDRYSIRCMPQFIGPIVESIIQAIKTIDIEMNSATDNPLIEIENDTYHHGGNFLGQHVAMAMDHMRVNIALLAKHNEAQVSSLVEPKFSKNLPASLVAEGQNHSVGIKPIQILMNSITPQLEHMASPLTVHFPVHAEQFNQNLNSQGYGSALMTRDCLKKFQSQLSATYIIAVQAALIRAQQMGKSWNSIYSSSGKKLIRSMLAEFNLPTDDIVGIVTEDTAGRNEEFLAKASELIERTKYCSESNLLTLKTQF